MQYYKSNITGRIFDQRDADILDDIYGKDAAWSSRGNIEKIDPPSVVDCIKHSRESVAVHRYREINNCKLADATKAVREIKARMKRNKK